MAQTFTMIVETAEDDQGKYYAGYFPDLPGCATMGSTLKELRANARDAIATYLQGLKVTGQPLPEVKSRILRIRASA
jgi:predicted RNase H-like HicB family nuclease